MLKLVFVCFVPAAGQEGKVEETLRNMVVHTRKEPGNLRYDLYAITTPEGRKQFSLLEQYVDDAAVEAHRDTDYYRQYRADIMPILKEPINVTILQPLDVR